METVFDSNTDSDPDAPTKDGQPVDALIPDPEFS
jgi:hypothetical protein